MTDLSKMTPAELEANAPLIRTCRLAAQALLNAGFEVMRYDVDDEEFEAIDTKTVAEIIAPIFISAPAPDPTAPLRAELRDGVRYVRSLYHIVLRTTGEAQGWGIEEWLDRNKDHEQPKH